MSEAVRITTPKKVRSRGDTWRKYSVSLFGAYLTDIGALGGRITWSFIGRFALCGGGFLSTMWLSQYMLHQGYTKSGYQLGIGSAIATLIAASQLNFPPMSRATVILGSLIVFITDVNGLKALSKQQAQ